MGDRYDDMKGPELADELGKRELSVTGKVDELRARLREHDEKKAQADADASDPTPEGEETTEEAPDVPEPREPVDYSSVQAFVLTEGQARILNSAEASLRRHFRYVFTMAERKYGEGDRVLGIVSGDVVRMLPLGAEFPIDTETEEG